MTCVLDASMALSFVLPDEFTRSSAAALEAIAREGALVPALWDYEISNGLAAARVRGRLTAAQVAQAINAFELLPIQRDESRVDRQRLVTLAHDTSTSTYDAAYLDLALRTNNWLSTLDKALLAAALKQGIRTTPR